MMSYLYLFFLLVAVGSLAFLAQKEYKHTDRYLWTLMILIPIILMGYWFRSIAHTPEGVIIALYFIYLDSTLMLVICLFTILQSVDVIIPSVLKTGIYAVTFAHLLSIWVSKDSSLYYASVEVSDSKLGSIIVMTPGPLKVTHYIYLLVIFIAIIVAFIYGAIKKNGFSRRAFRLYTEFSVAGLVLYVIEIFDGTRFPLLPAIYAAGSLAIVLNYDNFQSHDIVNLVGEKLCKSGYRGFAAFSTNRYLLGYNSIFAELVPEIEHVGIDGRIKDNSDELLGSLYPAIDLFEKSGQYTNTIPVGNKTYSLTVSPFSVNQKKLKNGYLLELADVTKETRQREIIEKYNEELSREVKEKTEHISGIQNSVVLGLANLIENRDDNTGGHVKRTSDIIKLLVEEIKRRKCYNLDEEKATAIIKAAPMHDLGKISIENSILLKPGKLTTEEYEIMKTHAAKSGEIVKIILEGVEKQQFIDTSFNLARHHHERWDGKGYPDGLMGERIPVEARIMAVADVYDALVSKRCYKEAMDFETAAQIMLDNMGRQFDPAMRPVFIACREKLENYYSEVNREALEADKRGQIY